jgi:hypothetical protein
VQPGQNAMTGRKEKIRVTDTERLFDKWARRYLRDEPLIYEDSNEEVTKRGRELRRMLQEAFETGYEYGADDQ